jgi:hypothetical protein
MFVVCKNYLISVLTNSVGFSKVEESRGPNQGTREARVYSMPERGKLEFNFNRQEQVVNYYRDWNDLDTKGNAKLKKRVQVANQSITFVIELYNKSVVALNADFNLLVRNLSKFIYDGQVAHYIDEIETDSTKKNKTDSKGNKIQVVPGDFDFNDNKFYGDIPSRCFMEIAFDGGVYQNPDPTDTRIVMDASKVKIEPAF